MFETRLLDEFEHLSLYSGGRNEEFMSDWYIREHHGIEEFWHAYISYRVRNENNPQVGRLLEVRQVAEAYCTRTAAAALDSTIDSLCWMALERAARWPTIARMWTLGIGKNGAIAENGVVTDLGLNLLSAAAYLGNLPLAKELLEEGHCPADTNELFDTPLQLAAWSRNAEIFQLFQERTGKTSIRGAAMSGDVEMLRLAIYPPSRADSSSTDFAGFPCGHVLVDSTDDQVYELYRAVYKTKSVDAFKYICSFFEHEEYGYHMLNTVIRPHCEWGNLDIVRHLLESSGGLSSTRFNVYGIGSSGDNCLTGAARGWREDVLDYLLESGMNPEGVMGDISPLAAAIRAGSISMVRKLVKHGASPHAWHGGTLLQYAVRLEHTAILEFLLDREVCRDEPSELKLVVERAMDLGLESMVEILNRREKEWNAKDEVITT